MVNELSIFMARLIALIYIPIGIGMLSGNIKSKELLASYAKSAGFTLYMGIFAVIFGTILVTYHNIWVKDWPVIVTLIGWIGLLEGVFFIAFPKKFLSMTKNMSQNENTWGMFAFIFGLVMAYFGFLIY